jgi:mono/diheme cytochrome c family protein
MMVTYRYSMNAKILVSIVLALTAAATPALTQQSERGLALAQEHCEMCHAIGRSGESPNRSALPLRRIGERFSLDEMQELLASGSLFAKHPQMPNLRVSLGDARALTIYLRSIQE